MKGLPRRLTFSLSLAFLGGLFSIPAWAQTVATAPVGMLQTNLAPSVDGTTRMFTPVSFPLHQAPVFAGTVAAVAANTVTLSGTLPSDLTSTPYLLHVTNAANASSTGQTFLIAASSSNSVTLSSSAVQIQSLLAANDTVAIRQAETLSSVFGPSTSNSSVLLQTGQSVSNSDVVYIWNGTGFDSYYYYPGAYWVRDSDGSNANQNNLVIYPDEAVLVGRISTNVLPASYAQSIGTVPANVQTASNLNTPGYTFISNPLPTPVKLSQFGFTNSPWWNTGLSANNADVVYMWQGNTWNAYYFYTGYYWVEDSDGSNSSQNDTLVPPGGGVLVLRRGAVAAPNNYVATPLNYSLN